MDDELCGGHPGLKYDSFTVAGWDCRVSRVLGSSEGISGWDNDIADGHASSSVSVRT
jgi:hypothetical protein